MLVACLCAGQIPPARADAPAATPFPEVPLSTEALPPHLWAYLSLGAGVGLVGSSFLFKQRADDAYDAYLKATDSQRIETLYDRTVSNDRLSRAGLLVGETLIATGLYLRFLRHPAMHSLHLALGPSRCGLSLHF